MSPSTQAEGVSTTKPLLRLHAIRNQKILHVWGTSGSYPSMGHAVSFFLWVLFGHRSSQMHLRCRTTQPPTKARCSVLLQTHYRGGIQGPHHVTINQPVPQSPFSFTMILHLHFQPPPDMRSLDVRDLMEIAMAIYSALAPWDPPT